MKRSRRMSPGQPLKRNTELRSTNSLERSSRLRSSGPTKAKRAPKTSAETTAKLIVSARSRMWCEIRLPGVCVGRAIDWSHRIARGRGGKWRASNGLSACRFCHEAITNTRGHRAEYERLGYIVRTGADTTTVPVWLAGQRWVLLDDEGRVTEVEGRDGQHVPARQAAVPDPESSERTAVLGAAGPVGQAPGVGEAAVRVVPVLAPGATAAPTEAEGLAAEAELLTWLTGGAA